MAANDFSEFPQRKQLANATTKPPQAGSKSKESLNEDGAAWPGVPGKTQPRNRSAGVPRAKIHPKSQGL